MKYYYPKPEQFQDWTRPDFKKYSGNIVVWGAGKVGSVAAFCLQQHGVEVVGFCDYLEEKWDTEYCGLPVFSPTTLKTKYPQAAVVISTVYQKEIRKEYEFLEEHDVFDPVTLFMEIDFTEKEKLWLNPNFAVRMLEEYLARMYREKEGGSFDQIFINITTRCTLKCKECSTLNPYVKKPRDFNAETIIQDLKTILDTVGHCRIVNFFGGEPLLHKELAWMIRSLKDDPRMDRITVITNGTLLPSPDLIKAMQEEPRFWLRLSDYGNLSTKKEELISLLKAENIENEVSNFQVWFEAAKYRNIETTEEELRLKFIDCQKSNSIYLTDRKLHPCNASCAVTEMDFFPKDSGIFDDAFVFFENADSTQINNQINTYVNRVATDEYFEICKYCTGTICAHVETQLPVAEQTKELLTFPSLELK